MRYTQRQLKAVQRKKRRARSFDTVINSAFREAINTGMSMTRVEYKDIYQLEA